VPAPTRLLTRFQYLPRLISSATSIPIARRKRVTLSAAIARSYVYSKMTSKSSRQPKLPIGRCVCRESDSLMSAMTMFERRFARDGSRRIISRDIFRDQGLAPALESGFSGFPRSSFERQRASWPDRSLSLSLSRRPSAALRNYSNFLARLKQSGSERGSAPSEDRSRGGKRRVIRGCLLLPERSSPSSEKSARVQGDASFSLQTSDEACLARPRPLRIP